MTFIEVITMIATLAVLAILMTSVYFTFNQEARLNNVVQEVINALELAKSKSTVSELSSQYGVYFDPLSSGRYILFKGPSYALRDSSYDKVYNMPDDIEVSALNLAGSGREVIFNIISGATPNLGNITVKLEVGPFTKIKTIYISGSGMISLDPIPETITEPIKDFRHTHFDYIRYIDTSTEIIVLTFDGGSLIKEVPISTFLAGGQIFWEGEIVVGGEAQKIKIHTHNLNNPGTEFCIHRDMRFNTKTLVVTLSGDTSGSLIEYSADGLDVNSSSIYVSSIEWQ